MNQYKEQKKECVILAIGSEQIKTKNHHYIIIQKTLVPANNKNGFSKRSKDPRGYDQPKWQNF